MGSRGRVRAAKRQMLVTCCFVWLLALSVATMAAVTRFGDHFAVISRASLERNPFAAMHSWAFYLGVILAGQLSLGAALSATATVREAQGLMAAGFLCFALVFCTLAQVAFWRFRNPTQVEHAVLDTYDSVYDWAMRNGSAALRQELAAIQNTFLCCGKRSPLGLPGPEEAHLCQGAAASRQDCLQSIRGFLRTHQTVAAILTSTGLALTVCAMLLSSFLWAAIRSSSDLDRRGKYALTPRAQGCRPQEPSHFRRLHPAEAPALAGPRGPRGREEDLQPRSRARDVL